MKKEIAIFTFDCTGCGRCVLRCPQHVLKLVDNGMCRFVTVVNEDACVGCGRCEEVCPVKAIKIK